MHTVVTMVAPSCSGKSLLVETLVNQLERTYQLGLSKLNFHVISSDDIRRELIGEDLHKHDNEMLYASGAAFDLLFCKLRNLLQFPLSLKNAVVFVDTTGLSKEFRDQVNKVAERYGYNTAAIVLDYKEYQDYFKLAENDERVDKSVVSNHVKRLRTKTLPQMRRKDYSAGIFKIKQLDYLWHNVEIQLTNANEYINCRLPIKTAEGERIEYTCLGDSHGCYDEVIQVLTKAGFTIEEGLIKNPGNKRIVCLDDYIDKGSKQKELIQFFYNNQDYIYHVLANHEDFVVRYFTGDIKPDKDSLQYFDSISWLKDTPELEELKWLHSQAKPFLIHPDFICTHSPCKLKHLGKLDKESKRAQLKHRLPSIYGKDFDTEEEYKNVLETNLNWLKEQAVANFPFIFSGHLSFSNVVRLGSQVMLDTGAVYGNKLTACTVKGRKLDFTQVQAKEAYYPIKYLTTIFDTKDKVNLNSLDSREQRRIKRALGEKPINWLSGTMSPSASNDSQLEPIETALEYYKSKGVTDLVMQCKEMGSNASFYWLPNPEDCYMVSRNGYLINQVDIKPIVDKFHSLIAERFPDATQVIVFGELKPWSALGKGLIDHHFIPIYSGMKTELEFSKTNGFDTAFSSLLSQAKEEFAHDRGKLSKAELRAKYGDAKVEWYNSVLQAAKYVNPVDIDLAEVEAYKEELDGYTQDSELDFQPFQVLKIERGDKVEVLPFDNYEGFKLFNSNQIIKLDLNSKEGYDTEVLYARYVYKNWVSAPQDFFGYTKLEGVVIKPLDPKLTNVAPYIKVRNPQYLKLVYGPTYNLEPTYSKLVKSKRISRKIKSSINEWQLGLEMLGIHSSQMTLDNSKAVDLMIKFIAEERKVEVLDPRL